MLNVLTLGERRVLNAGLSYAPPTAEAGLAGAAMSATAVLEAPPAPAPAPPRTINPHVKPAAAAPAAAVAVAEPTTSAVSRTILSMEVRPHSILRIEVMTFEAVQCWIPK